MRYFKTSWALLVALLIGAGYPAHCAQETGTAGSDTSPTTRLKGQATEIEVTLDNLRDARLSASRLRKAAANLYDEVTRQEMTMTMNPNVVGSTVIMTPTPVFTGQLLPPRKKWVDESMEDIGPIIKLFKEDVDAAIERNRHTDAGDRTQKAIDAIRDEVFALVQVSFDRYKELEDLTTGPTYDNKAIASAAKGLDSDMKKLDRSLKKGIGILQKEAKSSKKSG